MTNGFKFDREAPPGNQGGRPSGKLCVPAGVDGVCARRPRRSAVGAGEVCGTVEQRKWGKKGPAPRQALNLDSLVAVYRRDRIGAHPRRARARSLRSGGVFGRSGCSRTRASAASARRRFRRPASSETASSCSCSVRRLRVIGLLGDLGFGAEALASDEDGVGVAEDAVEDGGSSAERTADELAWIWYSKRAADTLAQERT
jgi:hypothetical protein